MMQLFSNSASYLPTPGADNQNTNYDTPTPNLTPGADDE
jgi:hypothetical protein